ncbi:MAG: hypothetical protein BWY75_00191 [bacterium ADurb.Bin425]|nr:MAG: hypothetical protein BWY75_00191 [bacterium ADurb.Bin425]
MKTFEQIRRQAAGFFWQAMPRISSRQFSIYDTGCGGADHSYQLEQRRQFAAQADREALRQTAPYSDAARGIEAQTNCDELLAYLKRWLTAYGSCPMPVGDDEELNRLQTKELSKKASRPFDLVDAAAQAWNLLVQHRREVQASLPSVA